MTIWLLNWEEKVSVFLKKYSKDVLIGFIIGLLTYFMMISLNLVNDVDGIWHLSNFIAGDWEISLGRGLLRYADRARFGIVSVPFNSILTILLIAITNTIISTKFCFTSKVYKLLFFTVMIANPIVCYSLSYSYTSVNYGLAYLFSVLSYCCINCNAKRKTVMAEITIATCFFAVSMALYQAYICVTCVLIIITIMKMLIEKQQTKKTLQYAATGLSVFVLGGLLYFLITKVLLFRAGVEMASYKGAASANPVSMLKALPEALKQCYMQFSDFILKQKTLSKLEFINIILICLGVVYLVAALIQFIKLLKHHIFSAIVFLAMIILLPVASCAVLLLAVGSSMTVLMSMGIILCIVILGIIVPTEEKAGFWISRMYILLLAVFAWFQLSAVTNDQLALKEGKTATITLTENIVSELYSEGYLNDETAVIAFVGRPANNDCFAQSTAYQMANWYARFGCWSTESRNNRESWNGVISNFLGMNLNLCDDLKYGEIIKLDQVEHMPEFPAKGSICVIDDIVVVKVSELY